MLKKKYEIYTHKGKKLRGKKCYICSIALGNNEFVFNLKRKTDLVYSIGKYNKRRMVESVELIGKKEAKCLMIDSPDQLYLTDDFIVTHNSHLSIAFALREILEGI